MGDVEKDARFAHVVKDPRFHKMPRKERKVKIDQRFNAMFKDKKFKLKYAVDKRGRPVHLTSNDHLKKYYEMSDSDDSDAEEAAVTSKKSLRNDGKESKKSKTKEVLDKSAKKKKDKKLKAGNDLEKQSSGEVIGDIKNKDKKKSVTSSVSKSVERTKQRVRDEEDSESDDDDDDDDEDDEEEDDSDGGDGSVSDEESGASRPPLPVNGPDYSRGEGPASNSEEDTDFEDDDEDRSDVTDSHWGELDKDAPVVHDVSCRLAVCNMDWDRIQAEDIYLLLNSFKPVGSVIKSIRIYPSEFGKEKMKEDDVRGPAELVTKAGSDDEEDDLKSRERLRLYQLSRLKYYYAVVECDSPETANSIYEQCDGLEYESSSTRLDLRFIPDDMVFEDKPKSEVTEMPASYKPSLFVSTALNQSKVELTWDEDDQSRAAVTRRKFTPDELADLDVQDYLASSDSDSETEDPYAGFLDRGLDVGVADSESEDEEESVRKYRELLQGIESKESKPTDQEMEITWEPGLKESAESLVRETSQKKESATPWQQYLEKKKEKKRQRKEEKQKARMMKKGNEDEDQTVESGEELPAGVDLSDPYFAEELGNTPEPKAGKKKKGKKNKDVGLTDEEKQQQAELAMLMEEEDKKQHFNLKSIMEKEGQKPKKKNRKRKLQDDSAGGQEDTFKVNASDPRFDALYSSHLYNIDPSSADFKKTKAMEEIMQEKVSRRKNIPAKSVTNSGSGPSDTATPSEKSVKDASLSSLVKSVKAKTQFHQEKRKKKQKR